MKKMLAKAVALSLVLGGVGFVSSNVQAAGIGPAVNAETGVNKWADVLSYKDGVAINAEAEAAAKAAGEAKATASENAKNITTNKDAIIANKNAIDKERTDRVAMDNAEKTARVDADKKLNAKIDSNAAKVQEQLDAQDNKNKAQDASIKANGQAIAANKDAIKANADAIKANKAEADEQHKYLNSRVENNTANIDKNKVAIENEAAARVDADKKLNAKIDSNAAKVQEQLDAQDNKNKAQDASIKANGQAIAANKDAIKANADAIKANKAEADEQHKYLNSRVENNTANIDKNKVAIENETQARVDADKALRADLNQETIDRVDADNRLQTAIDQKADKTTVAENTAAIESNKAAIAQEKKDRDHADQKLQDQITINKGQIENEATNRANEDKKLNAKIDAETDARKDADNALRTDLNQETIDRVDADNRLQTAIDQKADKTTVAENTAAIESNKAAIAQEKKDRDHADQKLQDQITINKGQIENEATNRANEDKRIEAKFDGEVTRLDGRIDKLNDNVQKVGAMAAAIANLHTMGYDPEAPTEIAVGVGQYRDKTGLALGAFHYPNRDFMLSFNVSTAGDEFMGGIGATWKFGRKSPEELRQAEAEKAAKAKLAKAEAAKKAAKDARVAAQQKRHAEMLAARTGK